MKTDRIKSRYYLYKIGFIFLIGSALLMVHTFLFAYFSPGKTITIGINWMAEAHLELFIILVFLPLTLYMLYDTRKNILPKIRSGEL